MFRSRRLKKVQSRFLESCRNLAEGRTYWAGAGGFRKGLLEWISPVPLLGLQEDGRRLLEALGCLEAHRHERVVDERMIREYHRLIAGSGPPPAGEYRTTGVTVVGSKILRSAPQRVPALMKHLEAKLRSQQAEFDGSSRPDADRILEASLDLYQRIGLIHPFADGNGRVARLAMNHFLRRYDLPYVILPPLGEAPRLWEALQEAHAGRLEPIVAFARTCFLKV